MTSKTFTDSYGTRLEIIPAANHRVTITLTDQTAVSATMSPGVVLGISREIVLATRLSEHELQRARAGKKIRMNKYTRLGEAEAPSIQYTDDANNEIIIYPDKDNHALIEVVGAHEGHSFYAPPAEAWNIMHALRIATGYTNGVELGQAAIEEGIVTPEPPIERHEKARHEKLFKTNPGYARLITRLEKRRVS